MTAKWSKIGVKTLTYNIKKSNSLGFTERNRWELFIFFKVEVGDIGF